MTMMRSPNFGPEASWASPRSILFATRVRSARLVKILSLPTSVVLKIVMREQRRAGVKRTVLDNFSALSDI